MLDSCAEVFPKFLTFDVSAGRVMGVGDTAFIYGMEGFESIVVFLPTEVVKAHIFGDAIEPRGEG